MVLLVFDPMLSFPFMVLVHVCFTSDCIVKGLVEELDGLFVVEDGYILCVHDPSEFLHPVSQSCNLTRFNPKHLESTFVLKTQWLQVLETEDNGLAVLLEWDLLVLEEP